MDLVLLVLLAFAFVGLISILKISLAWSIILVLMLALIYIAVRHPHGRRDWEYDIRTSLYFVVTAILLILMLYVMYLASGSLRFPPVMTMIIWFSVFMLLLLALLGVFFPEGRRSAKGTMTEK